MKYNEIPEVNTNDPWSATNHNTYIRENFMVMRPDVCIVGRSAVQTIPNGSVTTTYLSWDAEISDTSELHEGVTNPTYITVAKTGIYLVTASRIKFTAHATGFDYLYIVANTSTLLAEEVREANASIDNQFNISVIANLTATDYLRIGVKQTSGGDLDILRSANLAPLFSVTLLKDLTA